MFKNILPFVSVFRLALTLTQDELNYVAKNLDVKVKLTDNLQYDGKRHTMIITLQNIGSRAIGLGKIELFFHSLYMVEPDHLPDSRGFISIKNQVRVFHENGMLFKMQFPPIPWQLNPGATKEIQLTIQDWAVSRTDVINNWYITSTGLTPVILQATADNLSFVEDFTEPNQYKRYINDRYKPFTAIDRYERMKPYDLGPQVVDLAVLPTPKEVAYDTARPITIDKSWVISAAPGLLNEASYLEGIQVRNTFSKLLIGLVRCMFLWLCNVLLFCFCSLQLSFCAGHLSWRPKT